jgi:hypothetical protein
MISANPFDEITARLDRIENILIEKENRKDNRSEETGELLSRKQAAEFLQISMVTLDRYRKQGLIESTKRIGKPVWFLKSKLMDALKKLKQ